MNCTSLIFNQRLSRLTIPSFVVCALHSPQTATCTNVLSFFTKQQQFTMYAALDYLEEALGMHPGLPSRRQTGSHWIGYLCPIGDAKCYGYATATNVKMIALVSNVSESKLKIMFSAIHDHYVRYTMNPFSKIQGKVVSKRFSQGVKDAVEEYVKSTTTIAK